MATGQTPGDLHSRAEPCVEGHRTQTGEADEGATVLALEGPEAEAMTGEIRLDALDLLLALGATQASRKMPHHLGVVIQLGEGRMVFSAPAAQRQARAV